MTRKHILFVDMNESSHGVSAVLKAKELGYFITFFTADLESYKPATIEKVKHCFDQIIQIDTHRNFDELVFKAKEVHKNNKIDGVYASSDIEIIAASKIAEELKLPGSSFNSVNNARNKYLMREIFEQANVPQPRFCSIKSNQDVSEALSELRNNSVEFPLVFKPVDSTASDGVVLIYDLDKIKEKLNEHNANLHYARGFNKSSEVLLEEYIEGDLFSLEVMITPKGYKILGLTDRELTLPPNFVELSGAFPVKNIYQQEMIDASIKAIEALGLGFGACHIEFVSAVDGPRIIEINHRLPGFTISNIISKCRNIDIVEEIIKMYVGDPYDFGENNVGVGFFKVIMPPDSGSLLGFNEIKKDEKIIDFLISKDTGAKVTNELKSNLDVLGVITTYGDTKEKAVAYAHESLKRLKLTVG